MTKRLTGLISIALLTFSFLNLGLSHQPKISRAEVPEHQVYLPLVIGVGESGGSPAIQPTPTPTPTPSPTPESSFPSLEQFVSTVASGQSSLWRGLYAADKFAARITQQPDNNYSFISWEADVLTQYMLAEEDVVGLLAHNTHAGQYYFLLTLGDKFYLIADNAFTQLYQVNQIDRYQALQPNSNTSDYKNLDTGEVLTTAQIFSRYYMGDPHVTLQTCIAQNGLANWGRLFIVALPVE
ncbi:MAG: hypothetical protein Kow0088_19100 [Anaerolineales bacterium]